MTSVNTILVKRSLITIFLLISGVCSAFEIRGSVHDSITNAALPDVIITELKSTAVFTSDERGNFSISGITDNSTVLRFSRIGYISQSVTIYISSDSNPHLQIRLAPGAVQLKEISVTATKLSGLSISSVTQTDMSLRPTNSAQDLLRLVPGLFTSQHAGGGKAEQIFLRGFDVDHGTDFAVSIDGMPVNMVSHAHGQGYADFHFVIPETVDRLQVNKGLYSSRHGNFATAGSGDFYTKNSMAANSVKLEAGRFDTYRAVGLFPLPKIKLLSLKNENAYFATEYNFTNSYFNAPQQLNRFNSFFKYSGDIGKNSCVIFSASFFKSDWFGSGQIPNRAVKDSLISRFGSIDNSEGGNTSRFNLNIISITAIGKNSSIKNQIYYSHYTFDLYSNFTFFLNDSVNGDQIRQTESGRNTFGQNTSFEYSRRYGDILFHTSLGAGSRMDYGLISLMRSIKRLTFDTTASGNLCEKNIYTFAEQAVSFGTKFTIKGGLRYDHFMFGYNDLMKNSELKTIRNGRVSPKFSAYYTPSTSAMLYMKCGTGFHSNDSRSVVSGVAGNSLPRAIGYEVGTTLLLSESTLINVAFWGLDLESELVYVGDEGIVEISGATRRLGVDFSIRNQINAWLFIDFDINYNHGRYVDLPIGRNFIPLAPTLTSTGGISCINKKGFTASLRYRSIDSRPANEDNSVQAQGYFLLDAVASYTWKKFRIGISAENLLNAEWNEAQFDTLSKLNTETTPVSELHYTPGTPFFIKTGFTASF